MRSLSYPKTNIRMQFIKKVPYKPNLGYGIQPKCSLPVKKETLGSNIRREFVFVLYSRWGSWLRTQEKTIAQTPKEKQMRKDKKKKEQRKGYWNKTSTRVKSSSLDSREVPGRMNTGPEVQVHDWCQLLQTSTVQWTSESDGFAWGRLMAVPWWSKRKKVKAFESQLKREWTTLSIQSSHRLCVALEGFAESCLVWFGLWDWILFRHTRRSTMMADSWPFFSAYFYYFIYCSRL